MSFSLSKKRWLAAFAVILFANGPIVLVEQALAQPSPVNPTNPSPFNDQNENPFDDTPKSPFERLYEETTIKSESLVGNGMGEASKRIVLVHLPNGYEKTKKNFPVLYYLHGTGFNEFRLRAMMDHLSAAYEELRSQNKISDFIIVLAHIQTKLHGGQYIDSAASGNWSTFITKDLISYIDGKYRTIATRRGRALAGHSQGGFGTFYLAMTNAQLFSSAYAQSGTPLTPEAAGLETSAKDHEEMWRFVNSIDSWEKFENLPIDPAQPTNNARLLLWRAAITRAAAYAPDLNHKPFFGLLPWTVDSSGALVLNKKVHLRWLSFIPSEMLRRTSKVLRKTLGLSGLGYATHAEHLQSMKGLFGHEVGTQDEISVITPTNRSMDAILREMGVDHEYSEFDGKHNTRWSVRIREAMFPFVNRALANVVDEQSAN